MALPVPKPLWHCSFPGRLWAGEHTAIWSTLWLTMVVSSNKVLSRIHLVWCNKVTFHRTLHVWNFLETFSSYSWRIFNIYQILEVLDLGNYKVCAQGQVSPANIWMVRILNEKLKSWLLLSEILDEPATLFALWCSNSANTVPLIHRGKIFSIFEIEGYKKGALF